jgi:hypothetical protein
MNREGTNNAKIRDEGFVPRSPHRLFSAPFLPWR